MRMNHDLSNTNVSLQKENDVYVIRHDDTVAGKIWMENDTVNIHIQPEYQGRHYATNALYLFTAYAHDNLKVHEIRAVVPAGESIIKHVVEHCGYHIERKCDDHVVYVHNKTVTTLDDHLCLKPGQQVIYLAGGCFWGMERVFQVLDGVVETRTGYANGNTPNPSYEDIIRNETGYKECVRVIYDTSIIDIRTILTAYFMCIDPTVKNRQKEDIGTQYQTGIYYKDESMLPYIEEIYDAEKSRYEQFYVELQPLQNFYEAEEYHQHYLDKHPDGYCHITLVDLNKVKKLNRK